MLSRDTEGASRLPYRSVGPAFRLSFSNGRGYHVHQTTPSYTLCKGKVQKSVASRIGSEG